jgi:hypothetical protein
MLIDTNLQLDSSTILKSSTKNKNNDNNYSYNNQEDRDKDKENDNLRTSQTRFELKTNVKLKELNKTNIDESGILNMTNSEWRDNQKVAPFKLNTKFTEALNDTTLTNQIIGDLNKSTVIYFFIFFYF